MMTFSSEIQGCFVGLESSSRLEVMLQLLQMLNPMELRFIAVCLEDLARKNGSYPQFRDLERNANDSNILRVHFSNLIERDTRSLLTTMLPLVQSTNAVAANTIYNIVECFAVEILPGIAASLTEEDAELAEEIILLFTLCKQHPAFKFEERKMISDFLDTFLAQKSYSTAAAKLQFCPSESDPDLLASELKEGMDVPEGDGAQNTNDIVPSKCLSRDSSDGEDDIISSSHLEKLSQPPVDLLSDEDECGAVCPRCKMRHGAEASRPSSSATSSSDTPPPVYLTGIHVSCCSESQEQKIIGWRQIRLEGTWSSGDTTLTLKTPGEIYDYHRRLLDLFPKAAGCLGHSRTIPYFPGVQHLELDANKVNLPLVKKYMSILGHPYTCEFFGLKRQSIPDCNLYLWKLFDEPKDSPPALNPESLCPSRKDPDGKKDSTTTTTDEDRDMFVKNGTVLECVFHNSSSKPTHSQHSATDKPDIDNHSQEELSESCVSLPARLPETEAKKTISDTHLFLNGLGGSHKTMNGVGLSEDPAQVSRRHNPPQSLPQIQLNNRSSQTRASHGGAYHRTYAPRPPAKIRFDNYVPGPLYHALRRRNLTQFKNNLSRLSLEEVKQWSDYSDFQEFPWIGPLGHDVPFFCLDSYAKAQASSILPMTRPIQIYKQIFSTSS